MNKSETLTELAKALNKAQAELKPAEMNKTNPFLKNRYADLGSVLEAARPVLKKNGLSIAQFPASDDSRIGLTTILMHVSGEWLEETMMLPVEQEKGKSGAQVAGSIISYLRRYGLSAVLGIYADEDADGNAPKPTKSKTKSKEPPETIVTAGKSWPADLVQAFMLKENGIVEDENSFNAVGVLNLLHGAGAELDDIDEAVKLGQAYRAERNNGIEDGEEAARLAVGGE